LLLPEPLGPTIANRIGKLQCRALLKGFEPLDMKGFQIHVARVLRLKRVRSSESIAAFLAVAISAEEPQFN